MSEPPRFRPEAPTGRAPAGAPPPFRDEALAHHRSERAAGPVLRIAPRWTRWAFWACALAMAAALAAGTLVRVDRTTFVPAAISGTDVRAVVPVGRVAPGDRARLVPAGGGGQTVQIVAVTRAGAPPGAVLVSARATRPVAADAGVLRIRTGSRALIVDLIPGLT